MSHSDNRNIQTDGPLFELVQLLHIFEDSKAIADAVAFDSDENIRRAVDHLTAACGQELDRIWTNASGSDESKVVAVARQLHRFSGQLESLVTDHFQLPDSAQGFVPQSETMEEHIEQMWDALTRQPQDFLPGSTLIELKHPYVVPGGRYTEFYYWDSYFTSVGLLAAGRVDLLQHMIDNVADLINRYGFVPNGTRTYYLTRSQPPHFCLMLQLLAKAKGQAAARAYSDVLEKEYRYWDGDEHKKAVDNGTLNHYWDFDNTPRPEGFREDINTWYAREAQRSDRLAEESAERIYRDLRAAAESGWDFSSRWLIRDPLSRDWPLSSIRTTAIFPIDLNALLHVMESQLAAWAVDPEKRSTYLTRAARRREALLSAPFWDDESGWFYDVERAIDNKLVATGVKSLAGVYPLFCGLADERHATKAAQQIEAHFLKPGGVVTTTKNCHSGQQWDYPNGWAPLQWATVYGLYNYDHTDLAQEIAGRFVNHAGHVYARSGRMMEKYDVCDLTREGGGGEYPNQDGFGWTNAIVKAFVELQKGNIFWR